MAEKIEARKKGKSEPPARHPMDVFREAVKKILTVPKADIDRKIAESKSKKRH